MPYALNHGVRIYYEVEGDGVPLLLLHGTSGSLDGWREWGYADAFKARHRLVLMDLRGHGESDKPHDTDAYDWPILVEDATHVLDDLSISSTHVMGYSAGSYVAVGMAMTVPERVRSLIVGGASNRWTGISEGGRRLLAEGMESFVRATFEANGPLPPHQRLKLLANDPAALMASLQASRCTPSPEQLKAFEKLAFIYVGEADPRLADSREMAVQLPNATILALPELDHANAFRRADLVIPHLTAFLATEAPIR